MSAKIIDFAAARAARQAPAAAEAPELPAEALHALSQMFADAALLAEERAAERAKSREQEHRPMPACCDPANEVRGAKHDATRSLDIAEIAKLVRADIKALGLPAGVKISVRIDRYSMGQSLDVTVRDLPAGFRLLSDKAASWRKQFPNHDHRMPLHGDERLSPEWAELQRQLKAIHGAYNRDNSDSMSDYFDVRYYGDVGLDWQLRKRLEEAEIAAVAELWAEDSV